MKLIVLSPESDDPRENEILRALFSAGLERYHVRKPQWSHEKLSAWLQAWPAEWRSRMILHQHHDLVETFQLNGIHWKDDADVGLPPSFAAPPSPRLRRTSRPEASPYLLSRACHDLKSLRPALGHYDAVLLSPIFPSISKPGHLPRIAHDELIALLHGRTALERRTSVIALGGVTPENCARCAELGFDGVAVLGVIWKSTDPLSVFRRLQTSLVRHAA